MQEEAMKENYAIIQVQLPVEAATFLLNEKRAEIHKIEQRMGVQVVLIPNIHMETPNYSVTRIRNDDVSEEITRASYQMVEMPTDIESAPTSQEPKPVRMEAAVKGITPSSPAPVAAEKTIAKTPPPTTTGLIGRIKGWFGKLATKQETAKPEVIVRSETSRSNTSRNNRGNRNVRSSERQGNIERGTNERNAGTSTGATSTAARNTTESAGSERGNRNQQPRQGQQAPRAERAERVQSERGQAEREKPQTMQSTQATVTSTAEATGEQRGRRGRNNRRDRSPRQENSQNEANSVQNPVQAPLAFNETIATSARPDMEPLATPKPTDIIAGSTKPVNIEPTFVTVAETVTAETASAESADVAIRAEAQPNVDIVSTDTQAEATEKPEKKPRTPRQRKPAIEIKPVDLAASGLQLIETSHTALQTTVLIEPEQPNTPRKSAAWKKTVDQAIEEPLVLVETQK
jgi:ribonuclease E